MRSLAYWRGSDVGLRHLRDQNIFWNSVIIVIQSSKLSVCSGAHFGSHILIHCVRKCLFYGLDNDLRTGRRFYRLDFMDWLKMRIR